MSGKQEKGRQRTSHPFGQLTPEPLDLRPIRKLGRQSARPKAQLTQAQCDEKQPACSRCLRRQVPCIGAGQIKYKFLHTLPSGKTSGLCKRDSRKSDHQVVQVSRPPSNHVSRIIGSFASIISANDPGHSILSYGQFFQHVPRRLEQYPALVAAAAVLTSSVTTFYTGAPTVQAFTHYGKAIQTLRSSISSVDDTTTYINAILAIGLLCVSHNLLGSHRSEYETHVRGLLSLLSKMPDVPLKTDFDKQCVSAAWAVIIGECIMQPSIKIDERLVQRQRRRFGPIATDPAGFTTGFYSLRWENLVPLPSQLRDPALHHKDINATYQNMILESPRLITMLKRLLAVATTTGDNSLAVQYLLCESGNSELACVALVLNRTLQILDPSNMTLVEEAAALVSEIITAAKRLDRFKPLGTARVTYALCLGWLVAPTAELKAKMLEILEDHNYDFRGVTWRELAGRYQGRFKDIQDRVLASKMADRVLVVQDIHGSDDELDRNSTPA